MKALDTLDELKPGIAQEDWYQELAIAFDEHFKKLVHLRHQSATQGHIPALMRTTEFKTSLNRFFQSDHN